MVVKNEHVEGAVWIDAVGQEIKVGDVLAYGSRCGNTSKFELKRVIELLSHTRESYGRNPAVIIERIRVEPFASEHHVNKWNVSSRSSIIGSFEQVCVVTKQFEKWL